MFGTSVVIGFNDIYLVEDGPFYENFLVDHHLLHSQHVFDYIANQKRKDELMEFNHDVSFSKTLVQSITEDFEIEWPEGEESVQQFALP